MAYGFKLKGITIPDVTTAINAVISDGTTSTEYTMRGSTADGFSGEGASASYFGEYAGDPVDIYNNTITITADMEPYEEVTLQGIPQGVINDINTDVYNKLENISVKINGQDAIKDAEGWFLSTDNTYLFVYAYVEEIKPDKSGVRSFTFGAQDENGNPIPGNYSVEIKYPAGESELDITVNDYTSDDVGDEYNVSVSTVDVTESFKTAVEKVIAETSGVGTFIVEMAYNRETGYFVTDKTAGEIGDAAKTSPIIVHLTKDVTNNVSDIYAPVGYDPSALAMYTKFASSYYGGAEYLFASKSEDTNWAIPD